MLCRRKLPNLRACSVLYPFHNSEFYNPNNIRRGVGITKHPHERDFFSLLISHPRCLSAGDPQYSDMTLLTYVNLRPLQFNPSRIHCITYSHCNTSTLHNSLWGEGGAGGLQGGRGVSCIGLPPADNTSSFPFNCVAGCDRNCIGSGNSDINSFIIRAI
jgi:hypothetical protein